MRVQDIIYRHYIDQEKERIIAVENCQEIAVQIEELNDAIIDTQNRLDCKLINGKCSRLLVEQIARHRLNIGEKFNDKIEFYNASEILDTIESLENNLIQHKPFERTPDLIGYSKAHHGAYSSIGYSIVRNIREFWYSNGQIRRKLEEDFQKIVGEYESHGISAIANAMHSKALGTKELKGEWIIFKELNSVKYYLCLASHSENDQDIFDNKLKKGLTEFPGLIDKEV